MTEIQRLLNHEALLSNTGKGDSEERKAVHRQIIAMRGTDKPDCHGHDDCSTLILSMCPFRVDCGNDLDLD